MHLEILPIMGVSSSSILGCLSVKNRNDSPISSTYFPQRKYYIKESILNFDWLKLF